MNLSIVPGRVEYVSEILKNILGARRSDRERVDDEPDPSAQAVGSAINSLMAALDADDPGEMAVDVRVALSQLDAADELEH